MNSLLFKAGPHLIDDIPDPEMTRRFGNEESLLACVLCHSEENLDWARNELMQR